jgi:hypothetical protein
MFVMAMQRHADLQMLASYDFSDRNEADIRAEWIETLLRLLGYGLGTRHRVLRERPLQLRPPVRMVGSSRMEPDFIPTVFGRRLWIIEAKRPTVDLFGDEAFGPGLVLCHGSANRRAIHGPVRRAADRRL